MAALAHGEPALNVSQSNPIMTNVKMYILFGTTISALMFVTLIQSYGHFAFFIMMLMFSALTFAPAMYFINDRKKMTTALEIVWEMFFG